MSSLTNEGMKKDHQEETKELKNALRYCFYVRNRNVPLTPEAMDSLEFSFQEHMAKFKVEFEANDEKIHITLPDEDLLGLIRLHQELRDALDITKISTFFLLDPGKTYEIHIQTLKKRLLQTQNKHQKCGGLEKEIKEQQEILLIV